MSDQNQFVQPQMDELNKDQIKQNGKDLLKLNKQKNDFELEAQQKQFNHENELKDKEIGWIGKFFGTGDNSSKNIAVLLCLVLMIGGTVISCIAYFADKDTQFVGHVWNKILPVVTLSLGYIFGKK